MIMWHDGDEGDNVDTDDDESHDSDYVADNEDVDDDSHLHDTTHPLGHCLFLLIQTKITRSNGNDNHSIQW